VCAIGVIVLAGAAPPALTDRGASAPKGDPLIGQQWGLVATDVTPSLAAAVSRPVVVAVVDTGVDAKNPDLAGKVLAGWSTGHGSGAAAAAHGTAVAGIIAATAGNGIGIAGYCPKCLILPVRVLDANGFGSDADVAAGIRWAARAHARVINVSVGSFQNDPDLAAAAAYARSLGALVVAAAGNSAAPWPVYPAADPGVLSVGAVDRSGHRYSWSSSGGWVELAAPGDNLTTAMGTGDVEFVGTSSAAAVVSGIAALAFSVAPWATPDAVAAALTSSARQSAPVGPGVVDAAAAIRLLLASRPASPATAPGSSSRSDGR
jgi:hypothetical protein